MNQIQSMNAKLVNVQASITQEKDKKQWHRLVTDVTHVKIIVDDIEYPSHESFLQVLQPILNKPELVGCKSQAYVHRHLNREPVRSLKGHSTSGTKLSLEQLLL